MLDWRPVQETRFADHGADEMLCTGGVGRVYAKRENGVLYLAGPYPYA